MGRCIMKRIGSFALSVVLVFASVNTTAVAQNNDSKAIGSNILKRRGGMFNIILDCLWMNCLEVIKKVMEII